MKKYKKLLELVKEHLNKDENINASIFGAYETKSMGNNTVKNGILIATEYRLIFFAKRLFGFDLETLHYKNISSIEQSKGIMGHKITILSSGNKINMKWINTGNIGQFVDFINSKLNDKNKENSEKSLSNSNNIPLQIQKLSELKDKGILTDDEFLNKKNELLAKM